MKENNFQENRLVYLGPLDQVPGQTDHMIGAPETAPSDRTKEELSEAREDIKPATEITPAHLTAIQNIIENRADELNTFIAQHLNYKKGEWPKWNNQFCETFGFNVTNAIEQAKYVVALQKAIGTKEDGCLGRNTIKSLVDHLKGAEEYRADSDFASAYDNFSELMKGDVDKGTFRTIYRALEGQNIDFSNTDELINKACDLYNDGYVDINGLLALQIPYKELEKRIIVPEMDKERLQQLASLGMPIPEKTDDGVIRLDEDKIVADAHSESAPAEPEENWETETKMTA